jgi:hypothetical protein
MVQTRHMTLTETADSSSDTDMDGSPRVLALLAQYLPKNHNLTKRLVSIQPAHHAVPTILPISQLPETLETLLTQLPSAVKIEELDFSYI